MAAKLTRGFCLALDNIAKAMPADCKPVFRFRMEAIRCGNYLTADSEALEVTPATLKHWTDTFKEFKGRKIPVPVPSGTHFDRRRAQPRQRHRPDQRRQEPLGRRAADRQGRPSDCGQ
ncbi:MAG: hypothetical protein ACLP9L_11885 [Thermoguttaceae bacterium]